MNAQLLRALTGLSAAATVAATLAAPSAAEACGGFFCNRSAPVDQTGEHIIFAVDAEAGTTEAHVLINYAGPSEEFAWIVPTPSLPEVGLSSAAVFNRLDAMLSPQWNLNWSQTGNCNWGDFMNEADGQPTAGGFDRDDDADGGVTVISEQNVGPYDTVILQATDTAVLIDWLQTNGYDLPDEIKPFVEPYVLMGGDVHFVAFKLQSDRDAGDVQPVTLTYDGVKPMIPIQLTAVASAPDMGVTAYVLGENRAVPENYLSVEINYARLDWVNRGANYDELVTAAMNEAGGRGFRTEFAGSTEQLDDYFYPEGGYDYDAIAAATPSDLTDRLQAQGFFGDADIMSLFRRHLPVPEGVEEQAFYNCLECYSDRFDADDFDGTAFADDMWETMIKPLEHAQELVDRLPYITRMYSTLSAEEMTLDPIFSFNPDMDAFSNRHEADAIVDCGDGGDYYSSPIIIRLEDGREIVTGWDADRSELDAMPAADSFAETGAVGQPVVIHDNRETINVALVEQNNAVGRAFRLPQYSEESGCSAAPSNGATGFGFAGMLLGLALIRRR